MIIIGQKQCKIKVKSTPFLPALKGGVSWSFSDELAPRCSTYFIRNEYELTSASYSPHPTLSSRRGSKLPKLFDVRFLAVKYQILS